LIKTLSFVLFVFVFGVISYQYSFADTVTGYDYFDVTNPDGSHTWKNHYPYVLNESGSYVPFVAVNATHVKTGSGSIILNNGTYFHYNNSGELLLSDTILAKYADISNLNSWTYPNNLNNDVPDVSWNGTAFVSSKQFAGIGKLDYVYVLNGNVWNTQLEATNLSSLTTKVFGFDQIVDLNTDVIFFGGEIKNLDNFDGTTLGKSWLTTNKGKVIDFINGLNVFNGGTPMNWVADNIVSRIYEKLSKKFKSITKGDIKSKLFIVSIFNGMYNPRFADQIKSQCVNTFTDFKSQIDLPDFEKLVTKILKTPEIIDPITEIYKIKEELKKRQDLKSLNKTVKKIKSEKYLPSIGKKKYLALVEGESAFGGLSPVLGRKEIGYYILKGKPLNAYSADQSKFTSNKELSELYKIIQNENYEYIIYATDQDLDGMHIRGLLTGFFLKYIPELKGRIGMLQTPVIGVKKNNKLVRWYYNIEDDVKVNPGETSKYYKGLGSHKEADLKEIVAKDGLEKMIDMLEFDNDNIIDDWLGDNTEKRKDYILANDFSIAKL